MRLKWTKCRNLLQSEDDVDPYWDTRSWKTEFKGRTFYVLYVEHRRRWELWQGPFIACMPLVAGDSYAPEPLKRRLKMLTTVGWLKNAKRLVA